MEQVTDRSKMTLAKLLFGLGLLIVMSTIFAACGSDPTPARQPVPTERPAPAPVAAVPSSPSGQPTSDGLFTLTILHNNDGESRLVNLGRGLEDFGGVARFVDVVRREKQAALPGAVIMVSSGDNFEAGREVAAGLRSGVFYDSIALDLIGYDAIVLGNHDFDLGPDVLADFIGQISNTRPLFLSSNLDFSGEPVLQALVDEGRIAGSTVVEKGGERIGIVGVTTPELRSISSPRNVGIDADVAGEVQTEVDRLEANGVNKVILLSHLQDADADVALLGQVTGIDVVVAGGGDELLAGECDLLIPGQDPPSGPYPMIATDRSGTRVPVVTTPGQYSYLGKLVVSFDRDGRLQAIDDNASGPIRIAAGDNPLAVKPDCQVQREVLERLSDGLDDLTNPIAASEVDLEGRRSEVRSRETNLGNLMADALRWQVSRLAPEWGASIPDVAIQNGGGIRIDSVLPKGQIREVDTFDMAPFVNLVTVVEEVSRSQFKEILENAVSRAVEGDADGGSGRFAQVSGFKFEWSESGTAQVLKPDGSVATPGSRVQRVVLDSGPVIVGGGRVVPGDPITVATVDFLARGGDQYPYRNAPFTVLGVSYQQALTNYLESGPGLSGTVNAGAYPEGGEGRIIRLP